MNYGRAMRLVRAARGLSQKELAARVGMGGTALSMMELRVDPPRAAQALSIAVALDIQPAHLDVLCGVGDVDDATAAAVLRDLLRVER